MADFLLFGKLRIRNLEIFTVITLTIIYIAAAVIQPGEWLYVKIADLSQNWHNIATNSSAVLWTAFIFATFGNTTVLIVFPYALIVYDLAKIYPNFWLLGLVSGLGAAIGEVTSYLIGRLIARSNSVADSELSEKFHRMRRNFERKPSTVPLTVFLFAMTPLPDDMILVPMGMMKYPYWKSILPCALGKTVLTTFMSWLGYLAGQSSDLVAAFEADPNWNWVAPILKIVIPTENIDPAADLMQFSLVFIFIYFMVRLDFDGYTMKHSKERHEFQKLLQEGGNKEIVELSHHFKIENLEKFHDFMKQMVEKHDNISLKETLLHFDPLIDDKQTFTQSMELAEFLYK